MAFFVPPHAQIEARKGAVATIYSGDLPEFPEPRKGQEKGSGVIVFPGLCRISADGSLAVGATPSPDVSPSATATIPRRTACRDGRARVKKNRAIPAKTMKPDPFACPDGKTLATANWDGTVKLWHFASRQELITLQGAPGVTYSVAFAPDGQTLAMGNGANPNGKVTLWRAVRPARDR